MLNLFQGAGRRSLDKMEILKSQKHVFWEALIVAVFIFGVGIILGFWLENLRTNEIFEMYAQSELELLDAKLQSDILELDVDCKELEKRNVEFADQIYFESVYLKKYEDSSRLSDDIILQHKKYDLLRTMLWMNSMKIKQKCKSDYVNIVYFYQYKEPSLDQETKQNSFSKVLEEVKEKRGNEVILIPIAADLDIKSLNVLKARYNISKLPAILIDEKIKIEELKTAEEIERLL